MLVVVLLVALTLGVLIFVNRAPIIWYSKRQNTVESSTFGSEFTAMRTAVDLIEALRYKLRMFGVPIEGSTHCCLIMKRLSGIRLHRNRL